MQKTIHQLYTDDLEVIVNKIVVTLTAWLFFEFVLL